MRILITNDDGVHAPGLAVLESVARALTDDVWIIAPEVDQSGTSHSLTLNDPLRVRKVADRHFAVKGTPTDCVIMGLRHLIDGAVPDLVLSGVNRGQNLAEDVTYSGTVAGAMEAVLLGVPAIAMSQVYDHAAGGEMRWDVASTHGPDVVRKLIALSVPAGTVLNVNFPGCDPSEIQGLAVTRQGARNQALLGVEARHDGRGNPYYWLAFQRQSYEPAEGTDLWAVRNRQISVTPLKLDLTDHMLAADMANGLG